MTPDLIRAFTKPSICGDADMDCFRFRTGRCRNVPIYLGRFSSRFVKTEPAGSPYDFIRRSQIPRKTGKSNFKGQRSNSPFGGALCLRSHGHCTCGGSAVEGERLNEIYPTTYRTRRVFKLSIGTFYLAFAISSSP